MIKKIMFVSAIFFLLVAMSISGAIFGFHSALLPPDEGGIHHKAILKATYALERYESISDTSEAFNTKWKTRIKSFSRNHAIGVYVGEGSNATPFFPVQLTKMGFDIVRFDMKHLDYIKDCSLIVFPGGHYSLDFSKENILTIQNYIKNGGGYVGVCLGCMAADKLGIVQAELTPCPTTGLITCRVDQVFFPGSKKEIDFLHMNGRIFTKSDMKPLVSWGDHIMGGVKAYGKGRIVLFSSHPEGGKIEHGNRYVLAEGTSLGTADLLLDAIFYVAGAN